jgi:choline/glycine/proline betaine transport protein
MLTNGGDPHPIWQQRLFWAIMEGLVAAVLLIAGTVGGGNALSALQTAAITTGLPFCAVLLVMCYTLFRALSEERHVHVPKHVLERLERLERGAVRPGAVSKRN